MIVDEIYSISNEVERVEYRYSGHYSKIFILKTKPREKSQQASMIHSASSLCFAHLKIETDGRITWSKSQQLSIVLNLMIKYDWFITNLLDLLLFQMTSNTW